MQCQEGEDKKFPVKKSGARRGREPVLEDEHSAHLTNHFEGDPLTTSDASMESLYDRFTDLKVPKTTLYTHITEVCCFSFKKVRKITDKRNDPEFSIRSVFIDEAAFNLQMISSIVWPKQGIPATISVPSRRGMFLTIFSTFSSQVIVGLCNWLLKVSREKKRKTKSGEGRNVGSAHEGTKAGHCCMFIDKVMDELEKPNMKGYDIVMDNASIHHTNKLE
ncbi:hypothetical protein DFQ30_000261 [Apophysomyces sp. BC1015]|nr:hypothetical protein DFQ30_000261 [Apophysomyces sp. BC1015]